MPPILQPAFYNSITTTWQEIVELLNNAVKDRHSAFHTMNISYCYNNIPFCRTVVLRYCNSHITELGFHTDCRSFKIDALRKNPSICFHFYDPAKKIQITLNGVAQIHHKDDIATQAWKKTAILSRRCYLTQTAPGSTSSEPTSGFPEKFISNKQTKDETEAGFDHFTVIRMQPEIIGWLYLHSAGNRRVDFIRENDEFIGRWVVP